MKAEWKRIRDLAAAQYKMDEADAVENFCGRMTLETARPVTVNIDLSPFDLTKEQEVTIRAAANEYASWAVTHGGASRVDDLFLRQRIVTACEGTGIRRWWRRLRVRIVGCDRVVERMVEAVKKQ